MKAWLDSYRRDHPMRYELLMAKARQLRRTERAKDPDGGGRPTPDGRMLLERRGDRFDHDVGPFGHDVDDDNEHTS